MTPAYAKKLGLPTREINVGAQKINRSNLATHGMAIPGFQVSNKLGRACFFQEIFLLADTSVDLVLEMLFLTFSNTIDRKLTWRSYTMAKALATI